ncbi:MAG: ankyrin repeat domain-containing protein [Myxococcales bacterium]|nr:ankyrin repeat domain-containing protein [Myxococcales bacterium]
MNRLVLAAALASLPLAARAQTPEEQKVVDAFLLGSSASAASKEAALVKMLDSKPALAKSTDLLIAGLDNSGVRGELGARGRKLAELALARGADPNGTDKDGTPLLIKYGMFARQGPLEILLVHRANPNVADGDKRTALHWLATMPEHDKEPAAVEAAKAAAKLLLDKKADVNAADKQGRTALHIAAHNGAKGMVELLLSRGAKIDAVDAEGYSVLGSALLRVEERPGQPSFANDMEKAATREVIELLQKKGAKDIRPR